MKRQPINEPWQLGSGVGAPNETVPRQAASIRQVLGSLDDAHVAACPKPGAPFLTCA